jgi:hypothetical protein
MLLIQSSSLLRGADTLVHFGSKALRRRLHFLGYAARSVDNQ